MNAILTIIFIVSMILSSMIVNKIQRAYMGFIGADYCTIKSIKSYGSSC